MNLTNLDFQQDTSIQSVRIMFYLEKSFLGKLQFRPSMSNILGEQFWDLLTLHLFLRKWVDGFCWKFHMFVHYDLTIRSRIFSKLRLPKLSKSCFIHQERLTSEVEIANFPKNDFSTQNMILTIWNNVTCWKLKFVRFKALATISEKVNDFGRVLLELLASTWVLF